jgi:hypothetical protein
LASPLNRSVRRPPRRPGSLWYHSMRRVVTLLLPLAISAQVAAQNPPSAVLDWWSEDSARIAVVQAHGQARAYPPAVILGPHRLPGRPAVREVCRFPGRHPGRPPGPVRFPLPEPGPQHLATSWAGLCPPNSSSAVQDPLDSRSCRPVHGRHHEEKGDRDQLHPAHPQ